MKCSNQMLKKWGPHSQKYSYWRDGRGKKLIQSITDRFVCIFFKGKLNSDQFSFETKSFF